MRAQIAKLAVLILWAIQAQPASALDWPKRPVTVVVPLGAGGNTDMTSMRLFCWPTLCT